MKDFTNLSKVSPLSCVKLTTHAIKLAIKFRLQPICLATRFDNSTSGWPVIIGQQISAYITLQTLLKEIVRCN